MFYGLIDIGVFITTIVFLAKSNKKESHPFLWLEFAIYVPHTLLFVFNAVARGHTSLKVYQSWLRFKLLV